MGSGIAGAVGSAKRYSLPSVTLVEEFGKGPGHAYHNSYMGSRTSLVDYGCSDEDVDRDWQQHFWTCRICGADLKDSGNPLCYDCRPPAEGRSSGRVTQTEARRSQVQSRQSSKLAAAGLDRRTSSKKSDADLRRLSKRSSTFGVHEEGELNRGGIRIMQSPELALARARTHIADENDQSLVLEDVSRHSSKRASESRHASKHSSLDDSRRASKTLDDSRRASKTLDDSRHGSKHSHDVSTHASDTSRNNSKSRTSVRSGSRSLSVPPHSREPSKQLSQASEEPPPPFSDIDKPSTAGHGAPASPTSPTSPKSQDEAHGRRASRKSTRVSVVTPAADWNADNGPIFAIGDHVIDEGRVGKEMGVGTIVHLGDKPGMWQVHYEKTGHNHMVKGVHLKRSDAAGHLI